MRKLGRLRLEKFLARGRIEEKVVYGNGRPSGSPDSSTCRISAGNLQMCCRLLLRTRLQRTRETDAIEGSPSPRKPSVGMVSRSSASLILDVACRSKASIASSRTMPKPLSVTWISSYRLPPRVRGLRVAPASSAFSSNSFNHRRRPLDYFSGSDLVGGIFREHVDAGHEFSIPSASRREEPLFSFVPSVGRREESL